jgi:L-gulonate 5-dehydrogenase
VIGMHAVVVEGPGCLTVAERPRPEPASGEVRVRVLYGGLCGSDVHILHGENPFVTYPRVIGHEFAGRVEAVGHGVPATRVGELVAVDPVLSCGRCHPCSVGRPNVCRSLEVLGVHRDGGFGAFLCAPAANAHPVPGTIGEKWAATVEPFSIAANVTSRTGVFPRDVALVYGAGPIGLVVLQVLKGVHGVRVLVTDRLDERLERARACGADETINTAREDLRSALLRLGVDGPTLVVDAVGHPSLLEEAVGLAAPAARIGLLGFSGAPSALTQQELTRKELSIHASRLNAGMFPRVIEWMAAGRLQPERIVSHCLGFRDVARAFALFEKDARTTAKVLLDFGGG